MADPMGSESANVSESELQRDLKPRHVQMIAIGGTIGVGLFLGSGLSIHQAGPALLIVYAIVGAAIYLLMRALGEMLLYKPVAGSFVTYAREFIGPWAGFATGWTYWAMWVTTVMAEVTAIGIYVQYFFDIPQWIPALVAVVLMTLANLAIVSLYGELEFWFALIKIITILGLIAIGIFVLITGFGSLGDTASVANLWQDGGVAPNGMTGILTSLTIVAYSFLGIEIVGVTAGEAKDPQRTLPRAINQIVLRILIFYIGSLAIIMMLIPWNQINPDASPFVTVFGQIGIPAAAGIVTLVVITSALSSSNSGLYSSGRMMYSLAEENQAPRAFAKLSKNKVPAAGIYLSSLIMVGGVVINYVAPAEAFVYITSVATCAALWTWVMIVLSHLKFRRLVNKGDIESSHFRLPGAPWTDYFVLLFVAVTFVMTAYNSDTRIAIVVAVVWAIGLAIAYLFLHRKTRVRSTISK